MARQPRLVLPGQPQHVIQRGNNRDVIFASEDDYRFYLEKLADACNRWGQTRLILISKNIPLNSSI